MPEREKNNEDILVVKRRLAFCQWPISHSVVAVEPSLFLPCCFSAFFSEIISVLTKELKMLASEGFFRP